MRSDAAQLKSREFFGRRVTRRQLLEIRGVVEMFPSLSRHELAQTVCEHLGWRASSGENSAYAALKMLEVLESEGVVALPAKDAGQVRGARKAPVRSAAGEPGELIGCDLVGLGGVRLEVAHSAADRALFNELVDRYHELGYRQPVGCHLRYFIVDGRGRRLGCLLFQRASGKLRCRDEWIGWDGGGWKKRLERVVCNARFLILPWVRVGNLASHALSLAAARVGDDWQERWKVRPVLLETFVDGEIHPGTIYRAAGWERVGRSAGDLKEGRRRKDVYVKPLQADARAVLCGGRRTRRKKAAALEAAVADGGFVALWRGFVDIVAETAAEHDARWRVRRRTIDTLLVMLFVFRLAFSHTRQSYQITINGLWQQCRVLGVALPQADPVAASAMCAARQKVGAAVFARAHRRIVGRIGDDGIELWCGRRLYAVDGTKMNLPRELIACGYRQPAPGAHYPQGLVSCLYRLNDRMPMDFDLAAHGDERRMAAAHLKRLRAGDVVVYDRGYYSFELLWDHVRRGIDCVFRLPRNSASEFERFAESGERGRLVQVVPGRGALRRWRRAHPGDTPHPVRMRCLRIETGGGDFIVATTLTDARRFAPEALSDAYRGRWGIEELYKVSKTLVRVEQFHARTELGVRQELAAHFTIIALTRSFGNLAEDAISACVADQADMRINFKNALATVARQFEALMLGHAQRVGEAVSVILKGISECVSKARPGRAYPRISKRPDDRFRNANRRSGRSARNRAAQAGVVNSR